MDGVDQVAIADPHHLEIELAGIDRDDRDTLLAGTRQDVVLPVKRTDGVRSRT